MINVRVIWLWQFGRLRLRSHGDVAGGKLAVFLGVAAQLRAFLRPQRADHPVSYTHLTLPTIYSV